MPQTISPATLIRSRTSPHSKRSGYFIVTWGCQMNEEDSEQMEAQLQGLGYVKVQTPFEAKVILLNTCSVRKKPEDKAFSFLGELAPLKASRPDSIIGVCGCMAQARSDEILKRAPHVDFVLGTGDLGQLAGLVEQAAQGIKRLKSVALPPRTGAVVDDVPQRLPVLRPKLKAFLPIQYGCDKFCSFCIVPTTRGRERSRPFEDIVDEAKQIAFKGTKEVTLLGQTVNSYGKNLPGGKRTFSELLWALGEVEGLERIRFISPYPRDFNDDLISTIKECPKVMEHCHLPLQSGDNSMLKRMKRVYTVESFEEIAVKLRKACPGISLTTDIIVGFPGETEREFEETLKTVERMRFDGAYCFAYSPRPGTPAATLEQVPSEVKKERLNRLLDVQNEITRDINRNWVGGEIEVLVEGQSPRDDSMLQGYSREFKMVHFPGNVDRTGRIAKVKIEEGRQFGFLGSLVGQN